MGSEAQEEVLGPDRQVDSSALLFCSMTHTMHLLFSPFAKQAVIPKLNRSYKDCSRVPGRRHACHYQKAIKPKASGADGV